MKVNFSITGGEEIAKNFLVRKEVSKRAAYNANRRAGSTIKQNILEKAPPYPLHMLKNKKRTWKLTGDLKKSLKMKADGSGVELYFTAQHNGENYPYILEVGSSQFKARPYMRPGLYGSVNEVRTIYRNEYQKVVK